MQFLLFSENENNQFSFPFNVLLYGNINKQFYRNMISSQDVVLTICSIFFITKFRTLQVYNVAICMEASQHGIQFINNSKIYSNVTNYIFLFLNVFQKKKVDVWGKWKRMLQSVTLPFI